VTAPLWAVGSYVAPDRRRRPWRISHEEINRDIGTATAALGAMGVAGKGVLWCSMLSEAGQFWPYLCGTVMAGGRLSCADASEGEAARVAMFLRLMPYDAVMAVSEAILDGLDAMDRSYADVFGSVRFVGARPGAYERLVAAGLTPTRVGVCGPALVIGRDPGGPAYAAADEWALSVEGETVCVTSLRPRAQAFERTPVGVRASIRDGGLVWPCGRSEVKDGEAREP
jgi:hypothetical protein